MEAFAIDLANPLVDSMRRAATDEASNFEGNGVVGIPNNHAVPHNRMNVHAVEERDLAHVDWQLRIVDLLIAV